MFAQSLLSSLSLMHSNDHSTEICNSPSPTAKWSPTVKMLFWYSRPISSGPCLKLFTRLASAASVWSLCLRFLNMPFFLLCFSRNFLNTSKLLEKEAKMDTTQLDTFVWAMLGVCAGRAYHEHGLTTASLMLEKEGSESVRKIENTHTETSVCWAPHEQNRSDQ